jgi:hypothetical protein
MPPGRAPAKWGGKGGRAGGGGSLGWWDGKPPLKGFPRRSESRWQATAGSNGRPRGGSDTRASAMGGAPGPCVRGLLCRGRPLFSDYGKRPVPAASNHAAEMQKGMSGLGSCWSQGATGDLCSPQCGDPFMEARACGLGSCPCEPKAVRHERARRGSTPCPPLRRAWGLPRRALSCNASFTEAVCMRPAGNGSSDAAVVSAAPPVGGGPVLWPPHCARWHGSTPGTRLPTCGMRIQLRIQHPLSPRRPMLWCASPPPPTPAPTRSEGTT